MDTFSVLTAARQRIEDHADWWGLVDPSTAVAATEFQTQRRCAIQAVMEVSTGSPGLPDGWREVPAVVLLNRAAWELYGEGTDSSLFSVIVVNDMVGHTAVLECFDRALELWAEEAYGGAMSRVLVGV